MFVKICGITRAEDADAAVRAGASAIGFIFWPDSPRFIDPFRARRIARTLPPFITPVGVFVNQPAEYVNQVAALVRLGAVQLHGDENPEYARAMARPVVKAISTIHAATAQGWPANVMLLVDAHDPVKRGGTGAPPDWHAAARLARDRRILLAGGLGPETVAAAIAAVNPFGIDVSSGVERAPGIKDPERVTALFEALH
jgi:phosphoribosylanthranilate isomerase